MTETFLQYDVVRIKALPLSSQIPNQFDLRMPRIGDIATIIEIYTKPVGYELECSDQDGITQWMMAFAPGEAEFEHVD